MRIKSTEFVSIIVATIALIGSIISGFYSFSNRSRELDIELIKIGIQILRADPKETQTSGARAWAIEVVETYSLHTFSIDARRQLLNDRLGYLDLGGWNYDGTTFDEKVVPKKK